MLQYSDEDNAGETKQLRQKLQKHCNNHIFFSMLKGMRTLFALELWLRTSMKNYNLSRATLKTKLSGLYKLS